MYILGILGVRCSECPVRCKSGHHDQRMFGGTACQWQCGRSNEDLTRTDPLLILDYEQYRVDFLTKSRGWERALARIRTMREASGKQSVGFHGHVNSYFILLQHSLSNARWLHGFFCAPGYKEFDPYFTAVETALEAGQSTGRCSHKSLFRRKKRV